jgi:ribonuclease D
MNSSYITSKKNLEGLCDSFRTNKPRTLCVDTEFVRRTTYWPKLCLIQLSFQEKIVLIDPLSENLDLSPLKDIFFDDHVLKIFHAPRQDLEVLYRLWGKVPQNIADTQIIAMACGFGDSVSYEKLSESLISKQLDKSQQHTDWDKRPLSKRQIDYAAGDVQDLEVIYEKLKALAGSKIDFTAEEIDLLKKEELYKVVPEKSWLKIKARPNNSPEFWGILKELATARETYAQQINVPRSHVIKDDVLLKIALKKETSQKNLESHGIKSSSLQELLLKGIKKASPIKKEIRNLKAKNSPFLFDVLKMLLKVQSENQRIASKLITNREGLENFLEDPEESPLSTGWRLDVFGKTALEILDGKTALSFDAMTQQPLFQSIDSKKE